MNHVRRKKYGVRRTRAFTPYTVRRTPFAAVTLCAVLLTVFLCGCVRVAGTAGYWHTGQEGQLESKQAGFDTNDLVQKGKTPGSITV